MPMRAQIALCCNCSYSYTLYRYSTVGSFADDDDYEDVDGNAHNVDGEHDDDDDCDGDNADEHM